MTRNPIILSFDVGVINLSYCLLTKNENGLNIIEWNNIDLTGRNECKCDCGIKASYCNVVDNCTKYYCKVHSKKVDTKILNFEEYYKNNDNKNLKCCYNNNDKSCDKISYLYLDDKYYCRCHAKQLYKKYIKDLEMKIIKIKKSTTLNFDTIKYDLMLELDKRNHLLQADYVVIENQPSFKNPRMKSIASTLYDYYLLRGIIDKHITKSNIKYVKFMSPSNKLKLANENDIKTLVKIKNTNDAKSYKMTKALGIKYCLEMISHLPTWVDHFNNHKKKDDLADSFLQGVYYYTKNIKSYK